MSNIEILTAEMNGLSEKHASALKLSINKVKAIASDILDKTKIEMNESKTHEGNGQIVDVNHVIQEVINQKNILSDNKSSIVFKADADKVLLKNIDALDLERSISNILNNAVDASVDGSDVIISLKKNENTVEIQVKDSGFGISTENLKKIGVKGFSHGKTNGNGIGVYYTKQFIESLGGVFSVKSVVGQGTTVSMVLFE
jgi:signal transduction histidine kinase